MVPIPADSNHARSALATQLGINRGELLAGISGILLVEGKHDQIVLQRLFGSQLRAANLAVVRMHGTDNLMATAELDFVEQYLDVPIIVLLDYTKVEHIHSGQPTTDEERKLIQLRRTLKRRNRTYQLVGLERPDIPIIEAGGISQRHGHQVSRFSAPCRGKELRRGVSPQPDAQGIQGIAGQASNLKPE